MIIDMVNWIDIDIVGRQEHPYLQKTHGAGYVYMPPVRPPARPLYSFILSFGPFLVSLK